MLIFHRLLLVRKFLPQHQKETDADSAFHGASLSLPPSLHVQSVSKVCPVHLHSAHIGLLTAFVYVRTSGGSLTESFPFGRLKNKRSEGLGFD